MNFIKFPSMTAQIATLTCNRTLASLINLITTDQFNLLLKACISDLTVICFQ
jgi:hypothetical protein